MKSLLNTSSVADSVLASLWAAAMGPHDVKIYVRFYQWVDTSDHSLGFTYLGEIELTAYMEWGQLQTLIEEVEDFRSANFGVIKASSLAQEFIERTQGIAITEVGALLKDVLTENDLDSDYHYKYGGQDVHLWELAVKIGDASRDVWVSPIFSWIYGWLFDPSLEDTPIWDSITRKQGQIFTVTGYSLLHWLEKRDASWLGDRSNPSGDNTACTTDDVCDGLEDVCNRPTPPLVREILNHVGIKDDYIDMRFPPIDGGSGDFSTIELSDRDTHTAPTRNIPDSFCWKTVGNDEYWVYHPGWEDLTPPTIYVKIYNTNTGKMYAIQALQLDSNNRVFRRLWYSGSGDTFYVLITDNTSLLLGAWYVLKCTLSGTGDTVQVSVTGGSTALAAPSGGYNRSPAQCDLDMTDETLWASQSYYSGGNGYTKIGYWTLSSGAWSFVADIDDNGGAADNQVTWRLYSDLGGFRCVRSADTGNHGVCFLAVWKDLDSEYPDVWFLSIMLYDENSRTVGRYIYDNLTTDRWQDYTSDTRIPLSDGRGTVGGFRSDATTNERFYFQLPATWNDSFTVQKQGYWCQWDEGDDVSNPSNVSLASVGEYEYRNFSSHGSADLEYSTCLSSHLRGYYSNCHAKHFVIVNYLDGTTETTIYSSPDFEMCDDNAWPILGAPSVSIATMMSDSSRLADDDVEGRCFMIYKSDLSFLTIFSDIWIPNYSKDFSSGDMSLAAILQDISFTWRLVMRIGLWDTLIRKRYDDTITTSDAVMTITPSSFQWNEVSFKKVPQFDKVSVEYGGASPATYPSTSESKNVLEIESEFVLSRRASKLAEILYNLHKEQRIEYTINGQYLTRLEPLDPVIIQIPIPPGEVGYYDDESQVYRYNQGSLELGTVDEILAMVMRVEIDGPFTTITAIALGSSPGAGY